MSASATNSKIVYIPGTIDIDLFEGLSIDEWWRTTTIAARKEVRITEMEDGSGMIMGLPMSSGEIIHICGDRRWETVNGKYGREM